MLTPPTGPRGPRGPLLHAPGANREGLLYHGGVWGRMRASGSGLVLDLHLALWGFPGETKDRRVASWVSRPQAGETPEG